MSAEAKGAGVREELGLGEGRERSQRVREGIGSWPEVSALGGRL